MTPEPNACGRAQFSADHNSVLGTLPFSYVVTPLRGGGMALDVADSCPAPPPPLLRLLVVVDPAECLLSEQLVVSVPNLSSTGGICGGNMESIDRLRS